MTAANNPEAWSIFFSAQLGASAALTGLIFVAVSINLSRIIKMRQLVARSAKALFTLMGVVLASTLCMIPAQPIVALGWELAISGAVVWLASTVSQHSASHKNRYVSIQTRVSQDVLTQLATLPFIAGGVSLLLGFGGGLYWLVAGTIFSFIVALIDAWVLLIEIQR